MGDSKEREGKVGGKKEEGGEGKGGREREGK